MMSTEAGERIGLGPSEGAKSMRMVAWALGAIAGGGAAYAALALGSEPLWAVAGISAVLCGGCVVGIVAAARHEVWVDGSGLWVRSLHTTHHPWPTIATITVTRRQVKTPAMDDGRRGGIRGAGGFGVTARGERIEGETLMTRLVLVAKLVNGRDLSLPISVAEGTMGSMRVAELSKILNDLRRSASAPPS